MKECNNPVLALSLDIDWLEDKLSYHVFKLASYLGSNGFQFIVKDFIDRSCPLHYPEDNELYFLISLNKYDNIHRAKKARYISQEQIVLYSGQPG